MGVGAGLCTMSLSYPDEFLFILFGLFRAFSYTFTKMRFQQQLMRFHTRAQQLLRWATVWPQ